MNPDTGDEAEDWFAKFEREAREAALKREQEEEAAAPAAPTPHIPNPFDEPVAPPPVAPPPIVSPPAAPPPIELPPAAAEPPPTEAMGRVEPEPTEAMPAPGVEPESTQAMPTWSDEPTQALVPAPLRPPGDAKEASALDALFSDDRFREYEAGPDPNEAPFATRARSKELVHVPGQGTPPPPRFGTPQKILAGVGAGLAATIALIGLFLLGTRLPDLLGPAPAVVTASPTPTPTLTALPIGPVGPGDYAWDELLGGECLEPFVDAWQDDYTVVDCSRPHGGQLVWRAWFPPAVADPENPVIGKPDDPFPGVESLQAQISALCSAPGVVDLTAARAYNDIQIQGSYPVTSEQWEEDPSYYCFVSRSSGEVLAGSVAIPRVPAEPVVP